MQLKWGSYPFDVNECDVKSRSELLMAGGKPHGRRTTLDVSGRFYCNGQADCTTKQNALQTALTTQYQDLILYQDSAAASATLLRNAGSYGGVTITAGPNFDQNNGAEYATQRSFSFTAMAEYPLNGTSASLLEFTETLSYSGGGPLYTFRPNIYGLWQKQLVYPSTPYKVTQSGRAVGYISKPTAPSPIWPSDEHLHLRQIADVSPDRQGASYGHYAIQWTYQFESVNPLVGAPNLWPQGL
jgi:hypothetical protein